MLINKKVIICVTDDSIQTGLSSFVSKISLKLCRNGTEYYPLNIWELRCTKSRFSHVLYKCDLVYGSSWKSQASQLLCMLPRVLGLFTQSNAWRILRLRKCKTFGELCYMYHKGKNYLLLQIQLFVKKKSGKNLIALNFILVCHAFHVEVIFEKNTFAEKISPTWQNAVQRPCKVEKSMRIQEKCWTLSELL